MFCIWITKGCFTHTNCMIINNLVVSSTRDNVHPSSIDTFTVIEKNENQEILLRIDQLVYTNFFWVWKLCRTESHMLQLVYPNNYHGMKTCNEKCSSIIERKPPSYVTHIEDSLPNLRHQLVVIECLQQTECVAPSWTQGVTTTQLKWSVANCFSSYSQGHWQF